MNGKETLTKEERLYEALLNRKALGKIAAAMLKPISKPMDYTSVFEERNHVRAKWLKRMLKRTKAKTLKEKKRILLPYLLNPEWREAVLKVLNDKKK